MSKKMPNSFRLSEEATEKLDQIAKHFDTPKTTVLESLILAVYSAITVPIPVESQPK